MYYIERCFTSTAGCAQYESYMRTKEVCQKAKTCADCVRAHRDCGWASGHPVEWGSQAKCIVAPLWDWQYGPGHVATTECAVGRILSPPLPDTAITATTLPETPTTTPAEMATTSQGPQKDLNPNHNPNPTAKTPTTTTPPKSEAPINPPSCDDDIAANHLGLGNKRIRTCPRTGKCVAKLATGGTITFMCTPSGWGCPRNGKCAVVTPKPTKAPTPAAGN